MSVPVCPREQDLLEAVTSGRWPDRAPDELRAHAAACRVCGALAAVAAALRDEHDVALGDARVPDAGLVWRRAQIRARAEAARAAARPITLALGLTMACFAGVAVALAGSAAAWLAPWIHWLGAFASEASAGAIAASGAAVLAGRGLALALAIWLLLAPIAIYVALADD